jgi:hypothetical protein
MPIWEDNLSHAAEVLQVDKLREIIDLLANLRDTAHLLPDGTERQDALREIRGYQVKIAGLVRRLGSAAA